MSLQDALKRISAGQHSSGHQQDVEDAVINSYRQQFNRDPNQTEFSRALPVFDTGASAGQSYLAQLPEAQQADTLAKYNADPGKWNDQINQYFQSNFKRDASDAEKKHFGTLLSNNSIDQYGLNQFIQGLPEYQQGQDKSFQDSQRQGLQEADTKYYTDTLLPAIQGQMAKSGRSLESSGYASALAQAAKQQAGTRENYLTGLSASQYAGRQGNARTDYEHYINQVGADQTRNYGLQDTSQYSQYNTQRDAYNQYLAQYGKRSGMNGASGALAGAGSGAAVGTSILPGWGTAIGAGVGAGLGYFGSRY